MFGEEGEKTKPITLSPNGFEKGSESLKTITAADVGRISKIKVNSILIQLFTKENKDYRCSKIIIDNNGNITTFQCINKLEPCSENKNPKYCAVEYIADGEFPYEVTVSTADDSEDYGFPILVEILGSKGDSGFKMLTEYGANKNSQITSVVNIGDVGEVKGYRLHIKEEGSWKPITIQIKDMSKNIF
jgi:hypothetical protein